MQTNFKEIKIESDGLKLYAKIAIADKTSPTIILLHGLGFYSFEYDNFAPLLNKAGYNTVAFDFRSCGKSEGRRGYWTIDDYVEDTKNVVDYVKTNINNKIILLGNSLGADVAIKLTAKYPDSIRAIVSANCATRIADFALNPFRKFLLSLLRLVRFIPFRINVNYFIPYELIFEDKNRAKDLYKDELVTDARKFSLSTYEDIFSWDMTKIVPNIKVPILILQGKKDRLQPLNQAQMLYDAANEPKEIIYTETGHLPNIENPEYLSEIVVNWLKRNINE